MAYYGVTPPFQTPSHTSLPGDAAAAGAAVAIIRSDSTIPREQKAFVNVKDYGAIGNGIANDKPAIDAAVAAAGSNAILFPPGTYLISTSLTINNPIYMMAGAIINAATGVTLTLNGWIDASWRNQIFSWAGTGALVLGAGSCHWAPIAWTGALNLGGDDGARVQKLINACGASARGIYFGNSITITTGMTWTSIQCPVDHLPESVVFVNAATTAFSFINVINNNRFNLPNISGTGAPGAHVGLRAIYVEGMGISTIRCGQINNLSIGITFQTTNVNFPNLNNEVYITQINDTVDGIEIKWDAANQVQQGNEFYVNFLDNFSSRGIVFAAASALPAGAMNTNAFYFDTVDVNNAAANFFVDAINITDAITHCKFQVRDWMGGFIAGTNRLHGAWLFQNCEFDYNFVGAGDPTAYDGWTGASCRALLRAGDNSSSTPTALVAINNRAAFNGGLAFLGQQILVRYTVGGGGLAAGAVIAQYAYHPFADGNSNRFRLTPHGVSAVPGGLLCYNVSNGPNPNEIAIFFANISGALIPAGTTYDFMLSVGI